MTRRILSGFLAVQLALLALVVGPLGWKLSGQERSDFDRAARDAARSLAAAAEESLGDAGDATDRARPRLAAAAGDSVVVLDSHRRVVERIGRQLSAADLARIRTGSALDVRDAVVATAVIGSDTRRDGEVVVVRDAEPLHHRIVTLWLALAVAALATVALSVVAATLLARWIGRPLRGLENSAARMGRGEVSARTDTTSGPPEVRNLSSTFNEMAQRIASLLDGQRAITADVSHQLRTPLAALRLRLELLAEDARDDVASELLGALGEIARLNRLLDGLLAVARAEEAPSEPEPVDTAALLNGRLDLWQPVAADKSVTLTTSTADAWVLATPGHLEQILDNLIANSLDALQSGGHVDVSATTDDGCVVLTVCDDGPGMTTQSRESAFTRFDTDRAGRNAGLGLAIVARLVASDHGTIALDETPGGGLSAVIKLPSARARPDWASADRQR